MIPSQLISITPVSGKEKYNPELNEGDLLITKEELIKKLNNVPKKLLEGLIIRTLPNNEQKITRLHEG